MGPPGLGKSHTVFSTILEHLSPDEYIIIKGYSTPRGLYNTLYDNNGKLIIFDDCDSVLEDRTAKNILKSALDSYDTRTISWVNASISDTYPKSFEFRGRIIFISNKEKSGIDEAILSRSLVVDLSMTQSEKIERMTHILPSILPDYTIEDKSIALDFLSSQLGNMDINLRSLQMITKIKANCPQNWEDLSTYLLKQ
jgi:hypothetical protein